MTPTTPTPAPTWESRPSGVHRLTRLGCKAFVDVAPDADGSGAIVICVGPNGVADAVDSCGSIEGGKRIAEIWLARRPAEPTPPVSVDIDPDETPPDIAKLEPSAAVMSCIAVAAVVFVLITLAMIAHSCAVAPAP